MFFNCADSLLGSTQTCGGYFAWAYPYSFSYGTKAGWRSAHAQAVAQSLETLVGNVPYQHARSPANNRPVLHYALQAAKVVEEEAARHRVAVIHAASTPNGTDRKNLV